jgi:eukaryotic-like serine/threonine-protein kinase
MDSAKWQTIKNAMSALLDLPEARRADFLARETDSEVRAEVEKLLAANESAGEFIDRPILIEQGVAEDDPPDYFIGRQIENYLILERLGAGGMGAVYLAERLNSDFKQKIALKLIKRGMDSETILKRFARERKILSRLKHPFIAGLLDGGISGEGLPYFVMEFVEGLPLTRFCEENDPNLEKRLEIFRQIAAAVEYAHKNLIVHRDLKPSNVLIAEDGTPKLLDFGIAKLLSDEEETEATATQAKMFTPEYASPEQILGKDVTTGSDVYSLGVILYELLSGHRPFETKGKSFDEIVKSVCETEPKPPSAAIAAISDSGFRISDLESKTNIKPNDTKNQNQETNPKSKIRNPKSLRGDLDNIILKALRKEPSERYGSVQQFSEDISRFLKGLPVSARPQTLRYRFEKYFKRHKVGALASALVLLSLVGGVSVATWQALVARRERNRAEQRFNQVRQFANTVLFDYHDRIKTMPGATEVREKMVKDSLEYLDKLANESDYSIDLQRELALAYRKVGDIQGGSVDDAHIGQSQPALESYQKALAIQEKVVAENRHNLEDRRLIGNLMIDIASQYGDIGDSASLVNYAQQAIDCFRQLAREFPAETKPRSDLARALWTLAGAVRGQGDLDGGLELFRQSAELYENLTAEKPGDPKFIRNAALTYKNMGGIHEQKKDPVAALEFYRKALAIDLKKAESEPNNVASQMDLSFSYGSISTALYNSGKLEESLELVRKKLAIQEKIAAADQKNAFAQNSLAYTFNQLGFNLQKLEKFPEAADYTQKAIEIFKNLSAADPNSIAYRSRLANASVQMGEIRGQSGNRGAAEENYHAGLSIYKELLVKSPKDGRVVNGFIFTYLSYGNFLVKNGKAAAALESFRQALNVYESKSEADRKEYEEQLAKIYQGIGDAQVLLDQKAEARETYQKSLELWQNLQQPGKTTTNYENKPEEVRKKLAKLQNKGD